ncbi:hypothetical protein DFS34DRAFT_595880 [Phlyctochytrium arcticum]|nr:hypothetical protein DFS34DRAFT_595880 [Phlyctochytrium arcticum]
MVYTPSTDSSSHSFSTASIYRLQPPVLRAFRTPRTMDIYEALGELDAQSTQISSDLESVRADIEQYLARPAQTPNNADGRPRTPARAVRTSGLHSEGNTRDSSSDSIYYTSRPEGGYRFEFSDEISIECFEEAGDTDEGHDADEESAGDEEEEEVDAHRTNSPTSAARRVARAGQAPDAGNVHEDSDVGEQSHEEDEEPLSAEALEVAALRQRIASNQLAIRREFTSLRSWYEEYLERITTALLDAFETEELNLRNARASARSPMSTLAPWLTGTLNAASNFIRPNPQLRTRSNFADLPDAAPRRGGPGRTAMPLTLAEMDDLFGPSASSLGDSIPSSTSSSYVDLFNESDTLAMLTGIHLDANGNEDEEDIDSSRHFVHRRNSSARTTGTSTTSNPLNRRPSIHGHRSPFSSSLPFPIRRTSSATRIGLGLIECGKRIDANGNAITPTDDCCADENYDFLSGSRNPRAYMSSFLRGCSSRTGSNKSPWETKQGELIGR